MKEKYICMVSNEWAGVDKITIMPTVQSSTQKITDSKIRGERLYPQQQQQQNKPKKKRTNCYSHVPAL